MHTKIIVKDEEDGIPSFYTVYYHSQLCFCFWHFHYHSLVLVNGIVTNTDNRPVIGTVPVVFTVIVADSLAYFVADLLALIFKIYSNYICQYYPDVNNKATR